MVLMVVIGVLSDRSSTAEGAGQRSGRRRSPDTTSLPRYNALRIVRVMADVEDQSWEYTLGRISERTENIEKRLTRHRPRYRVLHVSHLG